MLPIALLVLTAAAAPVDLAVPVPQGNPAPLWEVWAGLTSGVRSHTQSPSATGRIAISRLFTPRLRAELELGTGAYLGDEQTVSLMRLGGRYELLRSGLLVPWLYAGFAHHHEVAYAVGF